MSSRKPHNRCRKNLERKNTIQIAEDIPEKDYGYRASSASRSVAKTLVHIAVLSQLRRVLHEEKRVSTIDGFDFSELIKRSELQEKKTRSKAEIIELLAAEGNSWFGWRESCPMTSWLRKLDSQVAGRRIATR